MDFSKVAIVSDIHANINALYTFRSYLDEHGIEMVLNLGDFINGGLHTCEVFDLIMEDKRFVNIRGYAEESIFNSIKIDQGIGEGRWLRDRLGEERVQELRNLTSIKKLEINGKKILLCHHNGWADIEQIIAHTSNIKYEQYDYILCGGTHLQELSHSKRHYAHTNIIDPGTLGSGKNERCYFAIIDFTLNEPEVRFHNCKIDSNKNEQAQKVEKINPKNIINDQDNVNLKNTTNEHEKLKEVYLYIQGPKQNKVGMMYREEEVIERIIQIGIRQCKYITIGCWSNEHAIIREVLYYLKCRKIKKSEKDNQEWYMGEITDDVIYLLSQRHSILGGGLKWFEISFQNSIEDLSPIYSIFNYGKKGFLKRLSEKELYSIEKMLDKYDLLYTLPQDDQK